ncbi:MAG: 50S ribosomal protein L24 [Patescibacteria group bacterium]
MHVKKDDNVIVITGKDKGKSGKIVRAFPKENKVLIAGVNIQKKHERPKKSGGKGQIIEKPAPIDASNVKKI